MVTPFSARFAIAASSRSASRSRPLATNAIIACMSLNAYQPPSIDGCQASAISFQRAPTSTSAQVQPPQHRRRVHQVEPDGRIPGADPLVVEREHLVVLAEVEVEEREMPPVVDREQVVGRAPVALAPGEPVDARPAPGPASPSRARPRGSPTRRRGSARPPRDPPIRRGRSRPSPRARRRACRARSRSRAPARSTAAARARSGRGSAPTGRDRSRARARSAARACRAGGRSGARRRSRSPCATRRRGTPRSAAMCARSRRFASLARRSAASTAGRTCGSKVFSLATAARPACRQWPITKPGSAATAASAASAARPEKARKRSVACS